MSDPALVSIRGLSNCGGCAGVHAETPAAVDNRPGLSAIAYRVGAHTQFKTSMLAALSDSSRPTLGSLRTRDDDDFSIALLDAAATMADVLTFYQERIANESYLRTATERRSVLELARLIGYELRPGVAAGTYLAFTTEETPGAPTRVPIDIGTQVQSVPGPGQKPQTFETVEKIEARREWNALRPKTRQPQAIYAGQKELFLDGLNTRLAPGDAILIVGDERLGNPNTSPDKERWDFRILDTVTPIPERKVTKLTWTKGLGAYSIAPAQSNVKCFALRQRANLFGYNAPDWNAMSHQTRRIFVYEATGSDTYRQNKPETWGKTWPNFNIQTAAQKLIDLDAAYPKILGSASCAGDSGGCSWVVLSQVGNVEVYRVTQAETRPRSDYAISSSSTRLTLDSDINLTGFALRETSVFAQNESLQFAQVPCDDVSGGQIHFDDGVVLDDLQGRWIAVSGLDGNKNPISEVVRVTNVSGSVLSVNPGLESTYAIDTVAINANIAQATHGETVQEVLGSGAAGITFQRFNLKQPPLTYVSAANASGVDSTLEIRVNDVLWHEVPTLYGRGPRDRVYISRQDDAGNTTAEFGDSITGARLPSGQMNVRARYRRGIGLGGLLSKGQLSMLLSRPHGLRGVTNPDDTRGAQDPERLDEARLNAPLTVMTLDRAVSLDDYEDFSRAFAGAAKAMASWMWLGTSRQIFITVSGPLGNPIPSGSEVSNNLLSALRKAGDPFLSIHVGSYRPVQFQIDATVKIDPDFESDKVLAEVKQKLLNAFSFDVRSFGEPVFLSEVISLVQLVPGVVALDVNTLYRAGATPSLEQRLLAEMPTVSAAGEVLPAELLTLDSAKRINLGVMS